MSNRKIKKKKEIIVTQGIIDEYIKQFEDQNEKSEKVLRDLFTNADHKDYNAVFCRVGLLDSLYSTQIQLYYKGGITAIADHMIKNAGIIIELINSIVLDKREYDLIEKLAKVDYSDYKDRKGNENKILSFITKYLSFCKPDMFPIMDSYVKKLINVSESANYDTFVKEFSSFRRKVIEKSGKNYTYKEIDMFLWQYARNHKDEINNTKLSVLEISRKS